MAQDANASGSVEALIRCIALFDDFDTNISPRDIDVLISVLRSIERTYPLLLETTTSLRALLADFRSICQDIGEERRLMRLQILRGIRDLRKSVNGSKE